MEIKNEIIALLTSGVLVLLFFIVILFYRNHQLSKKVKELTK